MSARIIDGKAIAAAIREQLAQEVASFVAGSSVQPHLVAILVGDDPASAVYVRNKQRACEKAGVLTELRRREFYEKPTQERKRKKAAAVKRHLKRTSREVSRRQRLY